MSQIIAFNHHTSCLCTNTLAIPTTVNNIYKILFAFHIRFFFQGGYQALIIVFKTPQSNILNVFIAASTSKIDTRYISFPYSRSLKDLKKKRIAPNQFSGISFFHKNIIINDMMIVKLYDASQYNFAEYEFLQYLPYLRFFITPSLKLKTKGIIHKMA